MPKFPENFLWSTSTAATQIEGGWNADGRGESIWDTLVYDGTGKIAHGENADTAIDFYHRWKEDVALMKQMGLKAYRFSISWPRILPEGAGRAIADGIPVIGYSVWSLFDNFEWAAGYSCRYGLVYVDYPTLKRTVKDSGWWYRDVIAANGENL